MTHNFATVGPPGPTAHVHARLEKHAPGFGVQLLPTRALVECVSRDRTLVARQRKASERHLMHYKGSHGCSVWIEVCA